jgi:hypothetical protein
MKKIENVIDNLKAIKGSFRELALEVVEEHSEEIAELNRQQLFEGSRPDGSEITPPYTPFTVARKRSKGQPFDRVTTRDTGAFHNGIKVEVFQNSFEMIGTDDKTQRLTNKYGSLLGLTQESRIYVMQNILGPGLIQKIDNRLRLIK